MRLLEFFNEAQEVEIKSPGTLQKVLDAFLSFTAQADELPPDLQAAEARCAVLRSRLDQSKEAGIDKYGKSPGLYGKMNLDAQDMAAVALALKISGTPQDAMKLKADLQGMRMEGLSGRGSEPTAKGAQGFDVQNQGVTRRFPGEGPGVNGGRSQSQQMDSYDQPQFKEAMDPAEMDQFIDQMGGLEDMPVEPQPKTWVNPAYKPEIPKLNYTPSMKGVFDPKRQSGTSGYDFTQDNERIAQAVAQANKEKGIPESQVQPAKGWDVQDPHQGSQEAGPILQHEALFGGGKTLVINPDETPVDQMTKLISPNSSLFWKLRQIVPGGGVHGIRINDSEVEELRHALIQVSSRHEFDDIIRQLHEAKIAGGQLDWQEKYRGAQFEAETEFGKWSVHKANGKWCHVFYPIEGMRVPYEDGYAPSPGHAMQEAERQYARLVKKQSEPEGKLGGPAGADALAPMGSVWQERKPLMNSRDKADESADMKDVQHRMKKVSAKMDKLKKSSEKEKKEHPWASKATAMKIAKDHEKLGEGVYRLTEFYALNEGKGSFFTLEPEVNGMGRLLSWEEDDYSDNGDSWYEPVASGNLDELLAALYKEAPKAQQVEDQIRQNFERAVSDGGEAVYFNPYDMTVDIMVKAKKSSEKTDPGSYEDDNPNRYF